MSYITIGKEFDQGKIAPVLCVKNDTFEKLHIEGDRFLLIVLFKGQLSFSCNHKVVTATAPAFLCFSEEHDPILLENSNAECVSIYFHPQFLNVNMTFERVRAHEYDDAAHAHDLFLLKPFLNGACVVPIAMGQLEHIAVACDGMVCELTEQRDWYWSCRGRSYFMEIIIALERMYGFGNDISALTAVVSDARLRAALLYIESHYAQKIVLEDVVRASGLNRTSLAALMKDETGNTVMQYVMSYRIMMAKKQLRFTEVPIKDIAVRCGFKTVPHFTRVFKAQTGLSPADFRKKAVQKRKEDFANAVDSTG